MNFHVAAGRSAVLVRARSSVGPISFATSELEGIITAEAGDEVIDTDAPLQARLVVPLDTLTSGNRLYDSELRRRINSRRFPLATIELRSALQDEDNRYALTGEMEFHDATRTISGFITVERPDPATLIIRGERVFDVREFNLETPTSLALKIYPDVSVELHLEARAR